MSKLSDVEFAEVVDAAGGIINAILLGARATDLANQDTELARHVAYLQDRLTALHPNINRVQKLLAETRNT